MLMAVPIIELLWDISEIGHMYNYLWYNIIYINLLSVHIIGMSALFTSSFENILYYCYCLLHVDDNGQFLLFLKLILITSMMILLLCRYRVQQPHQCYRTERDSQTIFSSCLPS